MKSSPGRVAHRVNRRGIGDACVNGAAVRSLCGGLFRSQDRSRRVPRVRGVRSALQATAADMILGAGPPSRAFRREVFRHESGIPARVGHSGPSRTTASSDSRGKVRLADGGASSPRRRPATGFHLYPEIMLICEELFLLLTKDSGAPESWGGNDQLGLRGAVLLDLVIAGRIELSADKRPRMTVLDTSPTGFAALDDALAVLPIRNGKRLLSLISWGRIKPRDAIAARLQAIGVIERTSGGLFGLSSRYPTLDAGPEHDTRERLYAVLHGERPAAHADLALLGILQSMGLASKILPTTETGMRGGELKRAITALRPANASGDAVARAIQDAINATTIAVVAATSAAATASQ